ncbi:unnamed protein product [Calypogeia fissa]
MGNAFACLAGARTVVKVMLPDATIEKYDHAIQVAELASMYPNYAVVHCSTAKPGRGQLRAVIIMKMDEFLVPGQAYILYRIPKSFNHDSFKVSATDTMPQPHPCQASSVSESGGDKKTKVGSGQKVGSVTAEELEKTLSKTLMGPAIGRKVPSGGLCLLDLQREEQEQEKDEKKEPKTVEGDDLPVEPSAAWTPDLYQISED